MSKARTAVVTTRLLPEHKAWLTEYSASKGTTPSEFLAIMVATYYKAMHKEES